MKRNKRKKSQKYQFKSFNKRKYNTVQVTFKSYLVCTFPFQLCKYGKKASQCKKFLMEIAPTKVAKYHPEGNENNQ